jgi:hypothetical protein
VTTSTDELIHRLATGAKPVHRLRAPGRRAALWLLACAAAAGVLIILFADMGVFMQRAHNVRHTIELAATLATGILAIIAAFQLALPDRSAAWVWLPLPTLALWLATAGWGCVANWLAGMPSDLAESTECFQIMVGASVPLGVSVLVALYRARPLAPARVAAVAGLGVAALSAVFLQFFHPFDVTVIDLAFHAAAVVLIVAVSAASARVATPVH